MKKLFFLTLILSLFYSSLFSQSEFKKGFIITNNQDTIYGLIDNRGEIRNALSCHFKKQENDDITIYSPSDIIGYRFVDDKFYISKEVTIENEMSKKFLEYLMHGIVDLYVLTDISTTHYYIQKSGSNELVELKKYDVDLYEKDILVRKTKKEYIGVLKYLFSDVPNIAKKVEDTRLNRGSLINIAEDYHNQVCKDKECIVYKKELPKVNISIGIIAGFNYGNIKYDNTKSYKGNHKVIIIGQYDSYWEVFYTDFQRLKSPTIGAFIRIPFPYANRLSIQYEALFSSSTLKSYYDSYKVANHPYSIQYLTWHNNLNLRYEVLKRKIRPIIFLGGSVNKNFNNKYNGFDEKGINPFKFYDKDLFYSLFYGVGCSYKLKNNNEITVKATFNYDYSLIGYFKTNTTRFSIELPIKTF